jgi:hypothetical protein
MFPISIKELHGKGGGGGLVYIIYLGFINMQKAKHCGVQPDTCILVQHQSRYFEPRSVPVVGYRCLLNEVGNKSASLFQANSRLHQTIERIIHPITLPQFSVVMILTLSECVDIIPL